MSWVLVAMKLSDFNNTCKICGREFGNVAGLHAHLSKGEKISPEAYYQKFFPKRDLLTGELIPFKNLADYKARLFVNKTNEFAFINKYGYGNPRVCNILIRQMKEILTKCARFPSYCEWRSSKYLRFDYLHAKGNLEPLITDALKLCRMNYSLFGDFAILQDNQAKILVDTREQKPLFKDEKTSINVGDYTFEPSAYNGIHIDRKSKADFIQTFTSGLERFEKECEKAALLDITLVVLVEADFSNCFSHKAFFGKVGGEQAFAGLRQVSRKYDVQFVFVDGRKEAKNYVRKILSNPEIVRNYDLQFLIESKLF